MVSLILQATLSATWFELRRSFSGQKLSTAILLALFPPVLMFLVFRLVAVGPPPELLMAVLLWIVGLLGLLMWIPPGIYSELEGQSWILSTSRPYGRVSLILGKYFSAMIWTWIVMASAYKLTTLVCWPFFDLSIYEWGFFQVVILAGIAYGAVFSLLSVLAVKRAMGFAVGYCLISEILIATVPAMVQKFTIRYHLQALGLHTISDFGLDRLGDSALVSQIVLHDPLPIWGNVLGLLAGSLTIMLITLAVANFRQLITYHET